MANDVQEITGGNWKIAARLCNFVTAQAFLLPSHELWLDSKLPPILRSLKGPWVDLIGYASRIGSTQFNQELSERRCKAVRDHVATYQSAINFRFNVDLGRGETESGPDELDNSGYYRAVELYVWGFKPPLRVPRVPRLKPIGSTKFKIRHVGGIGVVIAPVATDQCFFQIVDTSAKPMQAAVYFYSGGGLGVGVELKNLPPGVPPSLSATGPFVDFRTTMPVFLSSFHGAAAVGAPPSVTVGPLSINAVLYLTIKSRKLSELGAGVHPRHLTIRTGSGLGVNIFSATEGELQMVKGPYPFSGH
jgi:hypothetical protein